MKKFRILCLLLAMVMLAQFTSVQAVAAEQRQLIKPVSAPEDYIGDSGYDSSVSQGCRTIDAQEPLLGDSKMLDTAQGAFLYEVNTDTVIYAWNPDTQLPPASLVKMITCILAIENGNLDDKVTVTDTAIAAVPEYYHGDMALVPGEVFTLRDLLYLTMVSGSNDASAVIAEHIAGSQSAFVEMINNRAKEMGCTNSNFVDAHGIKQTNQYTTARDVAKIIRVCMKNADFMEFFSCQEYDIPATPYFGIRYVRPTHPMMFSGSTQIYYNKRITGARTGVTQERWRTIATTSQSSDLTYISVILCAIPTYHENNHDVLYFGSYEETLELLKLAYTGMRRTQVLNKDQISIQYPVVDGMNYVVAGPNSDAYTILPSEVTLANLEVRYLDNYSSLKSPVKTGDQLTVMQLWYNNVCIAQSNVIAKNSVNAYDSDAAIEIQQNDNAGFTSIVIVIAVVALAVLVLLLGTRVWSAVQRSRTKVRYSQRSTYRRRSR